MRKTLVMYVVAMLAAGNAQAAPIKRVWSKPFIAAVALAGAATVADVETTEHCLRLPLCQEGNALYGPRPSRAKLYAINAPVTGVAIFLAYGLRKTGYQKASFVPLAPVVGLHDWAAIHNIEAAKRYDAYAKQR